MFEGFALVEFLNELRFLAHKPHEDRAATPRFDFKIHNAPKACIDHRKLFSVLEFNCHSTGCLEGE